jgi:hypothetical protein
MQDYLQLKINKGGDLKYKDLKTKYGVCHFTLKKWYNLNINN